MMTASYALSRSTKLPGQLYSFPSINREGLYIEEYDRMRARTMINLMNLVLNSLWPAAVKFCPLGNIALLSVLELFILEGNFLAYC